MINFDLIFILLLIIQGRGTIRNKRVIFDALRQVILWPRGAGLTGAAPASQWVASATGWCLGMASGRDTEYRRCVTPSIGIIALIWSIFALSLQEFALFLPEITLSLSTHQILPFFYLICAYANKCETYGWDGVASLILIYSGSRVPAECKQGCVYTRGGAEDHQKLFCFRPGALPVTCLADPELPGPGMQLY